MSNLATIKTIWKIPNITRDCFNGNKINEIKNSKHFTVTSGEHSTEWCLSSQATADLGLYLRLKNCSTYDFKIHLRADLSTPNRKNIISRPLQKTGKEFIPETHSWGWKNFLNHNEILENFDDFVVDEALTVTCELTLHFLEPSKESFFSSCNDLFQDETFSDFKLESKDGKIFNVHKVVLVLKSEVFKRMLSTEMKETQQGVCKIEDFDSKVVEAMLKFIYFQEISDLDEIAHELIYAAEKYQLQGLKDLCFESIIRNLNAENVIEALMLSEEISESCSLYEKCVSIVSKNYKELRETPDWKKMSQSLLLKLYDSQFDSSHTIEV